MRDFLSVVGLLTLLYLFLCWAGDVPPSHGREVVALFFESVAHVVRYGAL